MIIRQEESNVNLDKPCPNHSTGAHKWGFTLNTMYCDNCKWTIPIARLICEHCKKVTKFLRENITPNALGLKDGFECGHCGEISSMTEEIQ